MIPHHGYLLFGSNLGDRFNHIHRGIEKVNDEVGKVLKVSSFYETEPWGVTNQPEYLNVAVEMETAFSPQEVFSMVKKIEMEEGRTNALKYAPRSLDIDILFYDDLVMDTKELVIPHKKIHLRRFTLIPLNEIAGELIHPLLKKTITELLEICPDTLEVKKFTETQH